MPSFAYCVFGGTPRKIIDSFPRQIPYGWKRGLQVTLALSKLPAGVSEFGMRSARSLGRFQCCAASIAVVLARGRWLNSLKEGCRP